MIHRGIETENELTALKLLNIQYGQGYFLARPALVDTFEVPAPVAPATTSPATVASRKARAPRRGSGPGRADESAPPKPIRRARRPRAAA